MTMRNARGVFRWSVAASDGEGDVAGEDGWVVAAMVVVVAVVVEGAGGWRLAANVEDVAEEEDRSTSHPQTHGERT